MSSSPLTADRAGPEPPSVHKADGPERYKQLFRSLASGVAVVTTDTARGPVGLTVSSLMAVSLTPPLLLVSLANQSGTLAALRTSGRFAVNLLHDDQQQLAARFASARPAWVKFAGVPLEDGEPAPVLDGVLASVRCAVEWVRPAGDHSLVLGQIMDAEVAAGRPLLWHASAYHAVRPRSAR